MNEQKNEKYKNELPSRAELHGKKSKKKPERKKEASKKRQLSIPSILVIILLLMPIAVMIYANKDKISIANTPSGQSREELLFEDSTDTSIRSAVSDESTEKNKEQEDQKEQSDKKGEEKAQKDKETDKKDQQKNEEIKDNKKSDQEEKKEEKEPTPPKKEEEQEKQDSNESQTQDEGGEVYHTVQPGETLFRIAMNHYQSQDGIEKIRQANGLSGNEISVGQKLKIPK
ncbi:LysM peptidoglycan-binding domain-containing protein [Bacillus sp. SD088]|uniref:LysM peptidoglycan-binding domain-containing protein n=1 Tax=Bacillus sp. SD088 TaxID=2782012 RepID=UPI001A97D161|nr:LysM peptidoglycan-binding domain-containing protein [Bacillus sp. SD088]MBO0995357.1 LysM peptidoglycan-binding domain-containing protein [Bacillus sp. SD088]